MKALYFLFAGALLFAGCTSNAETAENPAQVTVEQQETLTAGGVKTIRSAETKTLLEKQKDVVVIDVRTPEEFAEGHLENALHLNKYEAGFDAKIKALDRNKPYLLYCAAGGRSGDATRQMQQLGFKQVYDATEGFESLKTAGIPVAK